MLMDDDNFVVAGGVSIMDLQGATMAHFTQMNPVLMKKVSVAFQVILTYYYLFNQNDLFEI